jgi:hypothetical protein
MKRVGRLPTTSHTCREPVTDSKIEPILLDTMTATIEDLTPFFDDRCWMFILLARHASVGVIIRRGPTEWWRITRWDTLRDRFEGGQWFRGRMYPEKCDLSPDGKLFIYFAGKYRPRDVASGYHATWTAVSRPPYLTALALWPIGDTWGGQGVFLDDRTVLVATSAPSFGAKHHPDHPPGPLRVVEHLVLKNGDPRSDAVPCWKSGWREVRAPGAATRLSELRKESGGLTLGQEVPSDHSRPSRRRSLYTLYQENGDPVALFEAHWADWDQRGRLVAAVGGRVMTGTLSKNKKLAWRQLAAMNEEQPRRMEAPAWAQHW